MQNFLELWTQYNVFIINWLIITVVVLIGFVVFFAGVRPQSMPEGGTQISADLENTLKKLIEQQGPGKSSGSDSTSASGEGAASGASEASSPSSVSSAEVEELKAQIEAKEKQIQELQSAQTAAASGSGDGGQLQERIKELEARLSEYEIIAEDIADLSFYKEENQKLQKEIDEMKKKGVGAIPAASAPQPEIVAAPPPAAAPAPDPAPAPAAAAPPPQPEVVQAPPPAPAAEKAEASVSDDNPDVSEIASAPIDDDLMKEFAAAVESQKAASSAPEEPTTAKSEDAQPSPPTDENAQLLNQFEDFVKKS